MSDNRIDLVAEAGELLPHAIELRRRIHRHPELGNELPKTRQTVLEALADLDLQIHASESTSGVVAVLQGARPGPCIVLRGDMDALPMPEDTGLGFASEVEGRMHACGHDSHTAMLAAAARLLSRHKDELAGEIRFMFQPGEEGPGGAEPMIAEGLLDLDRRPDAAFALHIEPTLPAGRIACRAGALLAAADDVRIKVIGKGGHGSMPYDANDPIPVACELVQAFQTFVTRRFNTFDPVVLTVGRITAGTVSNVIPEHASMVGTLRSFSGTARDVAQAGIHRLAAHIAEAHEMRAEVEIDEGYPVTYNDSAFVEFLRQSTEHHIGERSFLELEQPYMGAEDFSLVLQRVPGAMAFLGVAPPGTEPGTAAPCHSNRMMIHEEAMAQGIALHAAVACDFLAKST